LKTLATFLGNLLTSVILIVGFSIANLLLKIKITVKNDS
jgi:hypothetical protein